MKSKLRTPALAGMVALALAACDSKEPGSTGTPAPTKLNTDQKSSHFDAVSSHLDLGGIVYAYMDIDGDAEKLAEMLQELLGMAKEASGGDMPPQLANLNVESLLDELGLTGIEALGMSSYQNGDLYRNRFYLHVPEGRRGLLKLTGGEPGEFAAKSLAPAGTDFIWEHTLDLKSVFALVRDMVGKVAGPEAAGEFARAVSEPMPGPGITITDIFDNLDTRLTIIGRVHPDKPMTLPEDVPMKVPGIDALIALDNVGPLFTKLLASIPEEERKQMVQEGDGYQLIAIPIPPEMAAIVQPVVRHDEASGRVILASSAAFLDECLQGKTSVWDDAGFVTAMDGLPQQGNGLGFASAEFMKEYLRVYGDAMAALMADSGGPRGMNEVVVELLQSLGVTPDHGQATVTTNLPEGMLMVSNSGASAKHMAVATAAGFVGGFAVGAWAPMRATQSRAIEADMRAREAHMEAIEQLERSKTELRIREGGAIEVAPGETTIDIGPDDHIEVDREEFLETGEAPGDE